VFQAKVEAFESGRLDAKALLIDPTVASTRADGSFLLKHVGSDRRFIAACRADYVCSLQPLTGEGSVEVRLGHGAAIAGRLSDASGQPVEGATVTAYTENRARSTMTGSDGSFPLEALSPEKTLVKVESPWRLSQRLASKLVEVPVTGEARVEFREPSTGVKLLVVTAGRWYPFLFPGDAPTPVDIVAWRQIQDAHVAMEQTDGAWEARLLPAGQFTLFVQGFRSGATVLARQTVLIGAEPEQMIVVPAPTVVTELRER